MPPLEAPAAPLEGPAATRSAPAAPPHAPADSPRTSCTSAACCARPGCRSGQTGSCSPCRASQLAGLESRRDFRAVLAACLVDRVEHLRSLRAGLRPVLARSGHPRPHDGDDAAEDRGARGPRQPGPREPQAGRRAVPAGTAAHAARRRRTPAGAGGHAVLLRPRDPSKGRLRDDDRRGVARGEADHRAVASAAPDGAHAPVRAGSRRQAARLAAHRRAQRAPRRRDHRAALAPPARGSPRRWSRWWTSRAR